jgi:hypothetical protein
VAVPLAAAEALLADADEQQLTVVLFVDELETVQLVVDPSRGLQERLAAGVEDASSPFDEVALR